MSASFGQWTYWIFPVDEGKRCSRNVLGRIGFAIRACSQRCYISAVEVKNGLMHNSISNKIRHESPFLLNKIRQESPFRSLECKPVRRGMIGQIDFRPAVLGNWFGRMRGGWYDIESYSTSIKITITPNVWRITPNSLKRLLPSLHKEVTGALALMTLLNRLWF